MSRKLAYAVAICAIVPSGAALASGPKYIVHHAMEPAVSPDSGRIYFYRPSSIGGMALEPAVKIDGLKVGESSSGDYFYVDRPPGTYTVSTSTEKEETVSVPLAAGQTVYVRFEVSMGLFVGHVSPELVANDAAAAEIADCHFAGTDTLARVDPAYPNPQPPYPDTAQVNGEQGDVVLNVRVTPFGKVRTAEVAGSSGFPDLDNSAVEGVLRWHFIPATEGGDTASSWTKVTIRYQLPKAASAAPSSLPAPNGTH